MKLNQLFFHQLLLAAIVSLWQITPTSAAITTFLGEDNSLSASLANSNAAQANFLSTLGATGYGTETFEGFNPMAQTANPNLTFPPTTVATTATTGNIVAATGGFGLSISGFMGLANEPGSDGGIPLTFTFNQPIRAFGSYFLNVADTVGTSDPPQILALRLENTLTASLIDVPIGSFAKNGLSDNALYFGVTDTSAFNKVTLLKSISGDGIVLDNVSVPEPGTFVLFAGLSVGLLLTCRRGGTGRKNRTKSTL